MNADQLTADRRITELTALLDRGITEQIGAGHTLGMTVEPQPDLRVITRLKPSPAVANALFTVHGGVLTTMLDTAMGASVFLHLPDRTLYTTLSLSVNFVRSVGLDHSELACEGQAVHIGRKMATAEARLVDATDRLIAHASCTCLVLPQT